MITIVCCIGNQKIFNLRLGKSLEGHEDEYVLITPSMKLTLPQAYNSVDTTKIKTKYIVFAHEDIYFYNPNWIKKIVKCCDRIKNLGLAGFAGIKAAGGIDNAVGHIDHWGSRGIRRKRGWGHHKYDNKIVGVQTVDSLGFVVPTEVFRKYKFNTNFPFHMMTEDYCLTLRYKRKLGIYVIPLRLWHNEAGLKRHNVTKTTNLGHWHQKLWNKWHMKVSVISTTSANPLKGAHGGYCPRCGSDIQKTPRGMECRVCHKKMKK